MEVIKVRLDNRNAAFLDLTDEQRETLRHELGFFVPSAKFTEVYNKWYTDRETGEKKRVWNGRKNYLLARDRCAVGLFLAIRKELAQTLGVRFRIAYKETIKPLRMSGDATTSDREYQNEAVSAMLANPCGGLVLKATGSGKTYTTALYLRKITNVAIFVVDELTLLYQAKKELAAHLGEPVGIIGDGKWDLRRVTVCTVQSLHAVSRGKDFERQQAYKAWVKTIDVVIIDEIHLQLNKRNFKVLLAIKPLVRIGLTATLQMTQKIIRFPAFACCGPVLYEFPLTQGVEEGYLANGIVLRAEFEYDGAAYQAAYTEVYNELITYNDRRNRRIISLAKAAHDCNHAIVIIVDLPKHVEELSKMANNAGLPHRTAYGAISVKDRIRACEAFEAGGVRLLVVNRVFTKGINLKKITLMIDGAGLSNPNSALQKYGRGVRTSEGKIGLTYIDIADKQSKLGRRLGYDHPFARNSSVRAKTYKKAGISMLRIGSGVTPTELMDVAKKRLALETKSKTV